MASISDIPKVWHSIGLFTLLKRVVQQVEEDNLFAWAASLAYAWLFAIFPFLIFLLSLLPYLPESVKDRTRNEIRNVVYQALPPKAAPTVWDNVNDILSRSHKGLLSIGLLVMLWGASGGVNMSISAIERCYEIKSGPPVYIQRPKAILLTIVVAILAIAILVLLPIGSLVIAWFHQHGLAPGYRAIFWFWGRARYPVGLLLMFAIIHILYYYGPNIRQRSVFFTPGAIFCVVVWVGLGALFRLYIHRYGRYDETYGTVGGVAILMLFFYIDAVVLLVGAEINSEIDFEVLGVPRGSRDFTQKIEHPPGPTNAY